VCVVLQEKVDMAKLRKYESDKMKYYYAVAIFDSVKTAKVGLYVERDVQIVTIHVIWGGYD